MLLLTLANVAALLLGESAARDPELATRAAIGATPARIMRDILTENAALTMLASLIAIVLAHFGTRALLAFAPVTLPHVDRVGIDPRVLAFAIAIAFVVAMGIGMAPALAGRRTARWSRSAGAGVTRSTHYEYTLLATQVVISTVLLAAAALLMRSLARQVEFDPGFRTTDVLAVRARTGSFGDDVAQRNRLDEQLRRLRALPGVVDASVTTAMPYREPGNTWSIELDASRAFSSESPSAIRVTVAPRFLETMNTPIVDGRTITDAENARASAGLVVNEAFVRRFSPNGSILGRAIRTPAGVFPVIGVARDTRPIGLEIAPEPTFYLPYGASPTSRVTFLLHARPGAMPPAADVHRALAAHDPDLALIETAAVSALLSESLADERYRTLLLGIFAVMATLIAAIGLAGSTIRALERRRKELCVRLSIGATPARAAATLLGRAAIAVIAGVVLGALAAIPAGRVMQAYLHGVTPADPLAIAIGSTTLIAASAAALYVPLRRLWQTDIARVLRQT
jgi:predicted permease